MCGAKTNVSYASPRGYATYDNEHGCTIWCDKQPRTKRSAQFLCAAPRQMFHMLLQGATLPSLTTRSLFFLNAEGTVRKKMFFRQRRFVLSTFTPQKVQVHYGAPASKTSFFPLNAGKKGEIIGTLQRIVRRQIENVP